MKPKYQVSDHVAHLTYAFKIAMMQHDIKNLHSQRKKN